MESSQPVYSGSTQQGTKEISSSFEGHKVETTSNNSNNLSTQSASKIPYPKELFNRSCTNAKPHFWSPIDTKQAEVNASAYATVVEHFKEKFPGMPEKIKNALDNKVNYYQQKGNRRNRPFGEKEFENLQNKITQWHNPWNTISIKANLNEDFGNLKILGDEIKDFLKNETKFTKLVKDILRSKLNLPELDKHIENEIDDLAKKLFANKSIGDREKIICMEALINKHCNKLGNVNIPPYKATFNSQNNRIDLIGPVRTRNVVFQGGGGKGVGYGGMLKIMSESGQLQHLKCVGGSSAGALAATAVAIGTTTEEFSEFVDKIQRGQNTPAEDIKSKYEDDHPMFQMLNPESSNSALGIIKCIDEKSREKVLQFLQNKNIDNINKDINESIDKTEQLTGDEQARLKVLQNPNASGKISEEIMITFGDLKTLTKIPGSPFKELTITAWDATNQEERYFDCKTAPNMPIAYAARASMSLPVVFEPVKNGSVTLYDGGLYSNSPFEIFNESFKQNNGETNENYIKRMSNINDDCKFGELNSMKKGITKQIQQQNTLMAIFDEAGAGHRADSTSVGFQYGTGIGGFVNDTVATIGGAHTSVSKNREMENAKLHNVGRMMIVGHGQLRTTSLNPTQEQKEAANLMSEAWTQNWITDHADEATLITIPLPQNFKNWDTMSTQDQTSIKELMLEVARSLDNDELAKVVEQKIPETQTEDPNAKINKVWYDACSEVYTEERGKLKPETK